MCVEGTWSLKRVIDQAAAARGSNRKAEQKSNLHLVAMHCGKNQWQSDRLGVVLRLDAPGRKGRRVFVCYTMRPGLCVCVSVNATDNSIERVREQTPKAAKLLLPLQAKQAISIYLSL